MIVYFIALQLAMLFGFLILRWTDGRPKMGGARDKAEWFVILGGAVGYLLL